jgi:hypothetical protein
MAGALGLEGRAQVQRDLVAEKIKIDPTGC